MVSLSARYYSRDFINENVDFSYINVLETDFYIVKGFKFLLSHLLSSLKLNIIHSRVLRRYVSLRCDKNQRTIQRLHTMMRSDESIFSYVDTKNGTMVSYLEPEKFIEHLIQINSHWVGSNTVIQRNISRDTGFYKKLFRIQFLFNHINDIYSDKYNVFQAAYMDTTYALRATLCFVVQAVSTIALMEKVEVDEDTGSRTMLDIILIVVTILYMFFNLPSNYITSSMSHNFIMLYVFYKMKNYRRIPFVIMDLLVNTIMVSFIPILSAKLLTGTTSSPDIVSRSLSVLFVTGLDDGAVTKSESNRLSEPQEQFLKQAVEEVDSFSDWNGLWVVAYLPWIESFLLLLSVIYAYFLLFF